MADKPVTTVTLVKGKDCKGSIRFETDDQTAPITNVYVSRALEGVNDARGIRVTVEIVR